ncbi:MAG: DMT family transporter [Formosimonas sp.]
MMKTTTWARWGLVEVAVFWGLSWVGYRALHQMGMSGMGAGVATSIAAALLAAFLGYRGLVQGAWRVTPWWMLALMMGGSAVSSLAFTWGMVHGEVMRVMLLFYLMPVWSCIGAHFILHERANWAGWLGVLLGLLGAALMLYDPALGAPWPATPAEWAGLAAGIGSATLNVVLRKAPPMTQDVRTFFLSLGGVILGVLWLPFEDGSHLPRLAQASWALGLIALMGGLLVLTSHLYQFGMVNLNTHQAVVIMPFELVVGAVSSWLLAGELMTWNAWLGGVLILAASVVSSWWGEH